MKKGLRLIVFFWVEVDFEPQTDLMKKGLRLKGIFPDGGMP